MYLPILVDMADDAGRAAFRDTRVPLRAIPQFDPSAAINELEAAGYTTVHDTYQQLLLPRKAILIAIANAQDAIQHPNTPAAQQVTAYTTLPHIFSTQQSRTAIPKLARAPNPAFAPNPARSAQHALAPNPAPGTGR